MATATARTSAERTRETTPEQAAPRPIEQETLYRLSLEQYRQMGQAGILTKEDRVVLLDGLLVQKMTKYPPHEATKKLVVESLRQVIPAGCHLGFESPVALPGGGDAPDSEPEPDVSVVRGAIREYLDHTPGPADMALIVEVADSSVREDRKGLARYARAGIPVAWIVNIPARCIEVYTKPTGPSDDPRYTESATFMEGETVAVVIDGREVGRLPVADLLP